MEHNNSHTYEEDSFFFDESLMNDDFVDDDIDRHTKKRMLAQKNLRARRHIEEYMENKRLRKNMDIWLDNNEWE